MKPTIGSFKVFVLLACFCRLVSAGQFAPVAKYPISQGAFANCVALGDFNSDGTLDIAVTAIDQSVVYILLGNGDGTYQSAKSYPGSPIAFAECLATGDFNKDGKLDLVVANGPDVAGVSILVGNGDGTFQPPVAYSAGPDPKQVAVGDFNADGNLDIVAANADGGPGNKGGVAVLLGIGDGTFHPYVLYSGGVAPNSIAMGDFNGDKIADLTTGTTGSIVAVLLGKGDGTFQKPIRNDLGVNPHYVGVGDFNNDGKLDAVATLEGSQNNKVVIALGNGDGTLQAPTTLPTPSRPQPSAVADFNRDGFQDLAIAAMNNMGSDGIYLLLGKGNASFIHSGNYATGNLVPVGIAVGDLNGDCYPDLVIVDGGIKVDVLLNTGVSQ